MPEQPKISALMVTQAGRFDFFRQSVLDYTKQTYPNKELLIVSSSPPETVNCYSEWLATLDREDIHWRLLPGNGVRQLPLGRMRNLTNDLASGDYCCTWDDDDRHHPQRLEVQLNTLIHGSADATLLNEQMHYFTAERLLYVVRWPPKQCPGFICYRRTTCRYPEHGANSQKGEDSTFKNALRASGYKLLDVLDRCDLYLRQYHGRNTWDRGHHRVLAESCTRNDRDILARKVKIQNALRVFGLTGPIRVMGRQGLAFTFR